MKSSVLVTVAVSIISFSGLCSAAEKTDPDSDLSGRFDQKKAEILQRIDMRMERLRQEKACVEAARNHMELKACKEKFKQEKKNMPETNKKNLNF